MLVAISTSLPVASAISSTAIAVGEAPLQDQCLPHQLRQIQHQAQAQDQGRKQHQLG